MGLNLVTLCGAGTLVLSVPATGYRQPKNMGYEVHETESGEQAAALMERAVLREGCWQKPLVLHAGNGAAMKSQTLQMKLQELKILPSHSRPRVSNNNAYAESVFRTLKYVPQWPSGFKDLDDARSGWRNLPGGTTESTDAVGSVM